MASAFRWTMAALAACGGLLGCHPPRLAPPPAVDPSPVSLRVVGPGGGARSFMLMLGSTVPLQVSARDAAGREVHLPRPATFQSRNPEIATVDGAGVITSVSQGDAWIVASADGVAADSIRVGVACTVELRMRYSPGDTTIRVGDSFVSRVELSSCGGHVRVDDTFTWSAADPRIVHVDSATGRTRGLRPGETRVEVSGHTHRNLEGFRVTVRPR